MQYNGYPAPGTPYGGNSYPPYGGYPQRPSETPWQIERRRLRGDSNFVGIMMLAMTAGMQLTFTVLANILYLTGLMSADRFTMNDLGLGANGYALLYAGVYAFAMAVPALVVALCARRRFFPLSPSAPVAPLDAFLGILTALGGCILSNVAANACMSFFSSFGVEIPEQVDLLVHTPESLLLNLFAMALLPALLEEMVFRGYVLRAFRAYGDRFAVVVSAVLFGLMHGNVQQIPFAFCVGLLLGWLYVRSNNIWLCVTVHFANNALSTLLSYVTINQDAEASNRFCFFVMFLVVLVGVVALTVLAARYSPLLRRVAPVGRQLTGGQRFGALCTSPALVAAVLLFIYLTVREM